MIATGYAKRLSSSFIQFKFSAQSLLQEASGNSAALIRSIDSLVVSLFTTKKSGLSLESGSAC